MEQGNHENFLYDPNPIKFLHFSCSKGGLSIHFQQYHITNQSHTEHSHHMTAKICPRIAEIIAAKFCQRIAEIIAMSPKPAAIATKGTCSTQNIEKKQNQLMLIAPIFI